MCDFMRFYFCFSYFFLFFSSLPFLGLSSSFSLSIFLLPFTLFFICSFFPSTPLILHSPLLTPAFPSISSLSSPHQDLFFSSPPPPIFPCHFHVLSSLPLPPLTSFSLFLLASPLLSSLTLYSFTPKFSSSFLLISISYPLSVCMTSTHLHTFRSFPLSFHCYPLFPLPLRPSLPSLTLSSTSFHSLPFLHITPPLHPRFHILP